MSRQLNCPLIKILRYSNEMATSALASRIAPLFGFTPEVMLECMAALRGEGSAMPESFYERLPTIGTNLGPSLGRGAYGGIEANPANESIAYKRILFYDKNSCRDAMVEAFIQAVLCTDPTIGSSICRLFRIYRSEATLVLEMERLPETLHDFIHVYGITEPMKEMLIEMIHVIRTLQALYHFQHSDFHLRNIMVKDNHIKLIDFGFARIEVEGLVYKTRNALDPEKGTNLKRAFRSLKMVRSILYEFLDMATAGEPDDAIIEKIRALKSHTGGRHTKRRRNPQKHSRFTRKQA